MELNRLSKCVFIAPCLQAAPCTMESDRGGGDPVTLLPVIPQYGYH